MDKEKKKRILANLILIVISVVISLLLAEFFLSKIMHIDIERSFHHRIPHPVLGWVLKPNIDYVDKISGEKVEVKYNSKGFRDVEHTVENEHGTFRILVLGDSFMEAYSVQLNDSFSRRLEQLGRNNGMNIEVINLGVGGYGTLQEYLMFHEIGKQYRPNIILLAFYLGNDLSNNSFALESISSSDSSLKVSSRPFLDSSDRTKWDITQIDYEGAQRRYLEAKMHENSFLKRLTNKSLLVRSSIKAARHVAGIFPGNHDLTSEKSNDQKRRYLAKYGVYYCQEPPEYTKAWDTAQRILGRLKNDASDIGSKLFVFTVPALHEVDTGEIEKITKKASNPGMICLEEATAYERLKGSLKRLNIEYLDLLPDFRRVMRDERIPLFHRSDKHWNKKGHDLAAKLVLSALIEKNLLPKKEYK